MPTKQHTRTPRLLVIDDEPESIAILLGYLRHRHLDILVALDGEDGFNKAVAGHPDLILLDIAMPGAGGYATCRQLKANPKTASIPVLFLSASQTVESKLAGFAAGASDYITKPFSPDEVLARIEVHLDTRRRLDLLETAARRQICEQAAGLQQPDEKIYARARDLLDEHLANPPTLQDLASLIGCSPRKITALFRKNTGMSVGEYCLEIRMESARRLLEGSNIQIQLIADQAGYQNPGDFTRAFLRRYGLTPRQFRQQRQAERNPL